MEFYTPQLEWIASESDTYLKLIEKWANVNSGTENLEGLSEMWELLADAFRPLNGQVQRLPSKTVKSFNSKGQSYIQSFGDCLSIKKRPEAPLQILLAGHMDTVFPKTSPFQTCTLKDGNHLVGPGTADMKGGLAILLLALSAIEQSPLAKKIGWEVFINADEEMGSRGSEHYLIERAPLYRFGLVFEPSFSDGALASERKGSANFMVEARGKAAHVGRDFHLGKSAITAIARYIVQAEKLQEKRPGLTLNVGHIEGGGPVNIIPDLATCKLNIRAQNVKDFEWIKDELYKLSRQESHQGIDIILHTECERGPKILDSKTKKLFDDLKLAGKEIGQDIVSRPTGGVCDGNILAAHGLPNIDTLGAVGGLMHTHQEYMLIDSLKERAQLTARFILQEAEYV